jgi:outer membrane immunogenic protein
MAVKAPSPPSVPVYNWTGWYVGGNVGYSWGRASADLNYFAPQPPGVGIPVCGPVGTAICINGSDTVNMNGVIGGVQAGYNWQNGNYLLGVEADFQGTGQRGTRDFAASFTNGAGANVPGGLPGNAASISITERMPWLGTVRGRLGWLATPNLLFFGTGGIAYGRIEVDSSASASAIPSAIAVPPTCSNPAASTCPLWDFSDSGVTKIGWTAGGGAELALGGNWTAKFEYLFVDLGSFDTTFTGLSGCFGVVSGIAFACRVNAAGHRDDTHHDNRQHRARRAELSIPLI